MNNSILKGVCTFFIIIALVFLVKILVLDLFRILKCAYKLHEPISYINKSIDLHQTGLIQEYIFKNKITGKHNIDIAIFRNNRKTTLGDIPLILNGEYRISFLSEDKLINDFFVSGDHSKRNWYVVSVYGDIGGDYYSFGTINLNRIGHYKIKIENLKSFSASKELSFELKISPIDYNRKIPKKIFVIELIGTIIFLSTCFIFLRSIKK